MIRGKRVLTKAGWATSHSSIKDFFEGMNTLRLSIYYHFNFFQKSTRMPKPRGAKNRKNSKISNETRRKDV